MEKCDALMSVITLLAFPLFSSSRLTTWHLTIPIHSPNGPLTQGANHIQVLVLRREGETFTGFFHRMQPLQPALIHH